MRRETEDITGNYRLRRWYGFNFHAKNKTCAMITEAILSSTVFQTVLLHSKKVSARLSVIAPLAIWQSACPHPHPQGWRL